MHSSAPALSRWPLLIVIFLVLAPTVTGAGRHAFRIVPKPRQMTVDGDACQMPANAIASSHLEVAELLADELIVLQEERPKVRRMEADGGGVLVWGDREAVGYLEQLRVPDKDEGYAVRTGPAGAAVAAGGAAGLRHGVQTLLQLREQSPNETWPQLTIRDWPAFSWRGFLLILRHPKAYACESGGEAVQVYKRFIRRLARYKYNRVALRINDFVELESHPYLWKPLYKARHITELVHFGRRFGIEVYPVVDTISDLAKEKFNPQAIQELAHLMEPKKFVGQLEWKAEFHKGFASKVQEMRTLDKAGQGEPSTTLNVLKPAIYPLLHDVLGEVIAMFDEPAYFHVGGDEAHHFMVSAPAELNRGRQWAEFFNKLHAWLKERDIRMFMNDDMLVSHAMFPGYFEANGGEPFNTWQAIRYLDRDILLLCWHYGYTVGGDYPEHYPMIPYFRNHGFQLVGLSWFKRDNMVNLARDVQAVGGIGMMGSQFSMHVAYKHALGLRNYREGRRKEMKGRKELGVFSHMAEAAWNPDGAEEAIAEYDSVSRARRWLLPARDDTE